MDVKVALSGEMAAFAESRLAEGRYSSMSELVDEALRLLESRKCQSSTRSI